DVEGRRPVGLAEQIPGDGIGHVLTELSGPDVAPLRLQVSRLHGLEHPVEPPFAGGEVKRSGDRTDAAVAEVEEITGRLPPRRQVVDGDRVDVRLVHRAPKEDDRSPLPESEVPVVLGGADRHQYRAVAAKGANPRDRS